MSALTIGAIVFACVVGGALFGMFLGRVLPKEHLSADARDVIKVTMAVAAARGDIGSLGDRRPVA